MVTNLAVVTNLFIIGCIHRKIEVAKLNDLYQVEIASLWIFLAVSAISNLHLDVGYFIFPQQIL